MYKLSVKHRNDAEDKAYHEMLEFTTLERLNAFLRRYNLVMPETLNSCVFPLDTLFILVEKHSDANNN